MYPLLRRGDWVPSVAAVQILLNRHRRRQGQSPIPVDGIFGGGLDAALRDFQEIMPFSFVGGERGYVGRSTWTTLKQLAPDLQVLDAIDITDESFVANEGLDVQWAGGTPILGGAVSGQSWRADHVIRQIAARARRGCLVLLRFHGHGRPGTQHVAGDPRDDPSAALETAQHVLLQQLRFAFCNYGSVELHGCNVGAGRRGVQVLRMLCNAWRVPVTAGVGLQYGRGSRTFRFEGHKVSVFPGGGSLTHWARSLPEAQEFMSVGP